MTEICNREKREYNNAPRSTLPAFSELSLPSFINQLLKWAQHFTGGKQGTQSRMKGWWNGQNTEGLHDLTEK